MNQRKYALKLISKIVLGTARPIATPLKQNVRLTTIEVDDYIRKLNKEQNDQDDPLANIAGYQRIIEKLLYFTIARPNLDYSVKILN